MKIAIFSQTLHESAESYVYSLLDSMEQHDISYGVYAPFYEKTKDRISYSGMEETFRTEEDFTDKTYNYLISLGGDGTILAAVTMMGEHQVPIMGINLGRLGFLASIEKKFIDEAIHSLINDRFDIEERMMLYLETNLPIFGRKRFALNDFTLHKRDTSSMMIIHTYVNGDFLNSYWSDGIIVSTPTGSTSYSLSCGGPIVFPSSGNFVITPVAPHNLNVRPIVISDDTVISFAIEGRTKNFLCTLDSRYETVTPEHQLAVRKCDFTTRLVHLHDYSFMRTIRNKLAWGIDTRNY